MPSEPFLADVRRILLSEPGLCDLARLLLVAAIITQEHQELDVMGAIEIAKKKFEG